ncbi:hypothetical protein BABINDRAFT_180259 [Babjeviella inositovora NRRL Y-12698]|uniref:Small ribosomal subunit protein uS5m n=1 Tax=Babjeviella inositovora NRRL Y-12698 TaxID=984486 RepID=A0A1E3QRW0_9ASCO|nr:uncharacterized protein BABINDRAFT_180259 [Babjeviella inositovora NRRL Y-12698]ODQ79677.1 hypothetical protein BABINDRAFT_180259 [Babjeviella inositovora NRRL Y-12698]
MSQRFFSTSVTGLSQISLDQAKEHEQFLNKWYDPKLLQSLKLAEGAVDPLHYHEKKRSDSKAPDLINYNTYAKLPWEETMKNPLSMEDRLRLADKVSGGARAGTREIAQGLAKLTGLSETYISKLTVRPLLVKKVVNQTKKGKIQSMYAMVVVGDKNGMVGLGEGKSRENARVALKQAHWNAVKNMVHVPRYEDRTILGSIDHRFHAVKLFLRSAPSGFGLKVNHNIFEICQCAGIKDLGGKVYKSRNSMNVAKAFIEAISKQKTLEELAVARGKKVVDLRKAYYSA